MKYTPQEVMQYIQEEDVKFIRMAFCDIYGRLFDLAYSDPDALHTAPHDTPVRRLDEVGAARNMILRYSFAQ